MKTNQYNGFKQIRQSPQSTGGKPVSAYLMKMTPTAEPTRHSKEINYRSSARDPEERNRPIRNPIALQYGTPKNEEISRGTQGYFPSKRPNSINTPHDDIQSFKTRGIGVTSKVTRPASGVKLHTQQDRSSPRQNEYLAHGQDGSKQGLMGSGSHGRLTDKYRASSGTGSSNTPTHYDQRRLVKEDYGYSKQLSEYQKLHEKLNSLENKIADMKSNLEKKRVEKETILEKQQRQRKQREAERNSRQKPPVVAIQQPKYKKNPPPQLNSIGRQNKEANQPAADKKKKDDGLAKPETALKGIVTQVPKHDKELHGLNFNPYSPRHNMYYVSEITRAYKEEKSLARQHLLTSMHILKIMESIKRASNQEMGQRMASLSKKEQHKDKKTVVFDLDQTLIHCNENTSIPYDVKLPITFPTGEVVEAGINIRPYAVELLKHLCRNFQIIVFTASHSCYANVVLDHLDPNNEYIQHRLYREHCYATPEGMYVKDLRVINRNLADMVLIDNAAYSYAFQLDNGIPIIPYYEGKNDYELKALQHYLDQLLLEKDVRDKNRKTFKLAQYRQYDNPDTLVKELYSQWIV